MIRIHPAVAGRPNGTRFLRDDQTWADTDGVTGTYVLCVASALGIVADRTVTLIIENGLVKLVTSVTGGSGVDYETDSDPPRDFESDSDPSEDYEA